MTCVASTRADRTLNARKQIFKLDLRTFRLANMLSSDARRANLTDDEAQGGGDRHHGPGESHGGVVHCLGRAHDEATADPGGCITHRQTQAGNKSRNVSERLCPSCTLAQQTLKLCCFKNRITSCHRKQRCRRVIFASNTLLVCHF